MVGVGITGLRKTDPKEYRRLYREANCDMLRDRDRERGRAKSNYMNGELDLNTTAGRGFISEMVVAKALGLDSDARCNCTTNFHFKYDLLDTNWYGEINVKSSKLGVDNCWRFSLISTYTPETYIFVAYSKDYKVIEHVWIIPAYAAIILDKTKLTISNSDESLSKVPEFEVNTIMYNVWLHMMSIDKCSVLKAPDFVAEMLQ